MQSRYIIRPSPENTGCFDVVDTRSNVTLSTVINRRAARQQVENFRNADIRRANGSIPQPQDTPTNG